MPVQEGITDYVSITGLAQAWFPDSPGVCHQATLILKTMGLKDQARRMGEHALQVMDDGSMDYESENLRRTLATLC